MSDTNKLFIGLVIVAVAVFCIIGLFTKNSSQMGGTPIAGTTYLSYGTASASTTAGRIIAKNADRQYAWIGIKTTCTTTLSIFPATSTDLVTAGEGIMLSSTTDKSWEIDSTNLLIEGIYVIIDGDAGDTCDVSWFEQ